MDYRAYCRWGRNTAVAARMDHRAYRRGRIDPAVQHQVQATAATDTA